MSEETSAPIPQHVSTRIEGPIAHVRLTRPDKLNGLTLDTLRQLVDAAHAIRQDRHVRAVILSGEGRSFSAGLDFATVTQDPEGVQRAFAHKLRKSTNLFQESCWGWRKVPVPVIAAVTGHCYGGGLQLALGADYRYTTADAQWSVLEAKWGLIPDMSGMRTLAEVVGIDVAKRLTWTGEVISGERAVELGLASEVAEDPYAAAVALAEVIATRSPDAVAAAKRVFTTTWFAEPAEVFKAERDEQGFLLTAENTAHAQLAAFTKQVPDYLPRAER